MITAHEADMLHAIAEFDQAEAWRGEGCLSMEAWLVSHCRVGNSRARALVKAAHKVGELPRLWDAMSEGRLTLDVLGPLTQVATPETDASLAESCENFTVHEARALKNSVHGVTDSSAAEQFERRFVRFDDARRSVSAQLPTDSYAALKGRLTRMARRYDHPSASDPDYVRLEQRLADALMELVVGGSRSALGAEGARGSGSGSGRGSGTRGDTDDWTGGRARPSVVVHVDLAVLNGAVDGHAFIPGIGPISPEVARRLSCDAQHHLSIDGPGGSCLDMKPLRRDPTNAQRLEIGRRDNGQCRWPGCHISMITDVHHMVEYDKGGPTILSNLITLCAGHHSRVHELGWKIRGDANARVTFTSPHGRDLHSYPSPAARRNVPMRT